MNTYYKVGIYLRLSDEDRDKLSIDDESESIKNQRNILLDYIKSHSNYILFDEYCDENLSGAGTFRPEFERLIKDCELRKIDIVLCKSQSRFSRDIEIIEKYINNKFIEWNVRFISLVDNIDTSNPSNRKPRQISALVNEWFLEDVSNNIRSAFYIKMKKGEVISPFAPYGYILRDNKLFIDYYASSIVKDIFNLYLNGYSLSGLCNYLNSINIPSPSFYKYLNGIKLNINSNKKREDIKWNTNAIKGILTNQVYIGNLIQGKRTTISYKNHKIINKDKDKWISSYNTHESIIDSDTFYKVQKELKRRSKIRKNSSCIHLFTGMVYCTKCNYLMKKKSSGKYNYLVCRNNCKNSIRYDFLEDIILKEINKLVNKYYDRNVVLGYFDSINDSSNTMIDLKKRISSNRIYLQSLYEDKVNGLITNEEFLLLSDTYNKCNQMYNMKLNELSNNKNTIIDIDKYVKFDKLTRSIVKEFIQFIHIDYKKNIIIDLAL